MSLLLSHWRHKVCINISTRLYPKPDSDLLLSLTGATASLPLILRFVTGHISVPSIGLSKPVKIFYLRDGLLPEAECCFNILKIGPTAHSTKEEFFESMDKCILMSGQHFYRE